MPEFKKLGCSTLFFANQVLFIRELLQLLKIKLQYTFSFALILRKFIDVITLYCEAGSEKAFKRM